MRFWALRFLRSVAADDIDSAVEATQFCPQLSYNDEDFDDNSISDGHINHVRHILDEANK